jgi:hypothetical protein
VNTLVFGSCLKELVVSASQEAQTGLSEDAPS